MNIYGIGTDIINIKRLEKSLRKNGKKFRNKIFTKKEMLYCDSKKKPSSYYAKRFAAKEAFVKSLGTGFRHSLKFNDISVKNNSSGKPELCINNKVRKLIIKKFKINRFKIFLSLSDEDKYSIAFVVIKKIR